MPSNMLGLVDVAFGTPWFAVIPGAPGFITQIDTIQVDNAGTNNGLYLMRPIGGAIIMNAQVATDTTLVLKNDPSATGNTIALNDQVVYLASDGTYRRVTVSSWSASTLTLTVSALPADVAAGSTMWNFGVYTDTEPTTSLAFPKLDTPVSVVTTIPPNGAGLGFSGFSAGQPLMIYCPNATAKTKMNYAKYSW